MAYPVKITKPGEEGTHIKYLHINEGNIPFNLKIWAQETTDSDYPRLMFEGKNLFNDDYYNIIDHEKLYDFLSKAGSGHLKLIASDESPAAAAARLAEEEADREAFKKQRKQNLENAIGLVSSTRYTTVEKAKQFLDTFNRTAKHPFDLLNVPVPYAFFPALMETIADDEKVDLNAYNQAFSSTFDAHDKAVVNALYTEMLIGGSIKAAGAPARPGGGHRSRTPRRTPSNKPRKHTSAASPRKRTPSTKPRKRTPTRRPRLHGRH